MRLVIPARLHDGRKGVTELVKRSRRVGRQGVRPSMTTRNRGRWGCFEWSTRRDHP